jgi:hypothetical protein
MGEQAGDATVCELLEGEVDLRLELGEGGRVASELLRPLFLLLREVGLEPLTGLLQRRDLRAGFAAHAKLHDDALTSSPLLSTSAFLAKRAFLGTTFRAYTR